MKTIIEELSDSYNLKVEQYISLHIRPKPKWLPYFVWKKILSRLLILYDMK
jgi:hypothetical protein